jgi:hypothetical protein
MQKAIEYLMGYLKNDLSSEDNACPGQAGTPGSYRGLPAGVGAYRRVEVP